MASDSEKDRTSFTGKYDLETKTARPKSVGPHHATRDQEDPADKGIEPGAGYANEIAEVNAARRAGGKPAKGSPVQIKVKGGAPGEPDGSG
ncbi:hypothetical protein [Falsiroseomonas ponticola]|uniref:hypothetical protein n=1 Tax=Falsiroseomonas ponticola TaxID=2786951 RepID=UPI0019327B5E|nr:hypothetical protein [Roseomonas ponticola]